MTQLLGLPFIPWVRWYDQIKSGRRTFRFKGNPQEYTLSGPVGAAKDPDIPRYTRRPDLKSPGSARHDADSPEKPSAAPGVALWWIAGLLVLLTGGGWIYFRQHGRT